MHIGRIDGATDILAKPLDWGKNEHRDHGKCASLPVRAEKVGDGLVMISAWFPTNEEIAALARGAPVYLHVVGGVHPPVAITVGNPPSEADDRCK